MIGPFLMGLTLFAQASLGVPENPTRGMQTGIVACMIIYTSFWMVSIRSVLASCLLTFLRLSLARAASRSRWRPRWRLLVCATRHRV